MIQPSSCMLPGPPSASTTNAWVLALIAGACTTCCAICAQYGHWSQLLSSCCSHCEQNFLAKIQNPRVMKCCSHCEQNFLAKIQNPRVMIGGFGLGPAATPGIPGIPCGIWGIPCGCCIWPPCCCC